LGENMRFRVPDGPSAMVRPENLDVETFCLGCEDSAPKIESR